MDKKLKTQLRIMQVYTLLLTLLVMFLSFSGFKQQENLSKFQKISVERINIVEENGTLRW